MTMYVGGNAISQVEMMCLSLCLNNLYRNTFSGLLHLTLLFPDRSEQTQYMSLKAKKKYEFQHSSL